MMTCLTPWSARTPQIPTTRSSSSSGGIAGEPVALGAQPPAGLLAERLFPLGEQPIVIVGLLEGDAKLETGLSQQLQERRQRGLPASRLVSRQSWLGHTDQLVERGL